MGTYWNLLIGRMPAPVWGKNYIPDELMLVFTDSDYHLDDEKRAELAEYEHLLEAASSPISASRQAWETDLCGYISKAKALRVRLELQGLSTRRTHALSTAFFNDDLAPDLEYGSPDPRDAWPAGRAKYPDGAAVTKAIATRRGMAAASTPRPRLVDPEDQFLHDQWRSLLENFDDPRFALSLALTHTRDDTAITLDLTELILSGWLSVDDVPHKNARERLAEGVAASGPVIVITEGSSDARWLKRALEVSAPAAAHLFEFLDFGESRAPGGTDRVVSLTRGMSAARVMNRIVAVLDNDTAGLAARNQLAPLQGPGQISVVMLPDVPYATQYPTLGPEGAIDANVNGRAASIEFMFGEDVLRDPQGTFFPVRWRSFEEGVGQYQGRLDNKQKFVAGERIDRELSQKILSAQVVAGCDRLASMLLLAAEPPAFMPASEFSGLTSAWRRDQGSASSAKTDGEIKPF